MSLALYRHHRPRQLADLVGQDHIRPTLEALLAKAAKATAAPTHAILLTGPRGVGKTSVARIIAYLINGLEAASDKQHLDIIEIDGASHNRVDQIRDLIDKARIAPSQLKYKVYIIDEVHTLAASQVSFQAFLKTLEEPPEHVVFILATTEIDKVPATIISRCQRFAFRLISATDLAAALTRIAKAEKIKIDGPALGLIASHSQGSLRDGLSILDQLGSLEEPITAEIVRQTLGLPRTEQVVQLHQAATGADLPGTINQLRQLLIESGASVLAITDELINRIRQTVITDTEVEANLRWLDDLIAVRTATQPEAQLEVALIRRVTAGRRPPADDDSTVTKTAESKPEPATKPSLGQKPSAKAPAPPASASRAETKASASPALTKSGWTTVVDNLPKPLKTLVSKARTEIDSDGHLNLDFSRQFEAGKFDDQPDGLGRRQKLLAAIEGWRLDLPGTDNSDCNPDGSRDCDQNPRQSQVSRDLR